MAEKRLYKVRVKHTRGELETGYFFMHAESIEGAADKALAAAEDEWDVQPELGLGPGGDDRGLEVTSVAEVNGTWVP